MVEMNLLPWRAKLKVYQVQQIKKIIGAAWVVGFISLSTWALYLTFKLSQQQSVLQVLQTEFDQHDLMRQSDVFHASALSNMPFNYQDFFATLNAHAPQTVCFSQIARKKNTLLFRGESSSAFALTDFLLEWKGVTFFSEIKLEQLEKAERSMKFRLLAALKESEAV